MDRRFIESHQFPADRVSEASSKEKQGGGRPPYWEMVFWWTRKPLASARAVIAGALLPDSISREEFMYATRLSGVEGVPHRNNPFIPARYSDIFRQARLLDPFSGFGSIPLEAIRLGVGEVVAVELLPVAYVFLKAVLEIPKWASDRGLGEKLVEDVGEWGEWVLGQLRMDGDIQELYDGDTAVYIGSWEIKCPHCGRYTPLIGNWWLARTSRVSSEESESEEEEVMRKGLFQRLAWMEPVRQGDTVHIGVVDLNKELGRTHVVARVNSKQGLVEVEGRQYRVPRPNIDARRETAICLLCNNQVGKVGGEWYVKTALREWNQNLEKYLSGQMTLRQLQDSRAMPRLLVKVKIVNGELVFEPATQQDNEKLWKALEKLRQVWGDPDIPTELLPSYESRSAWVLLYGFDKWFKLFNPRQLLTLVKLVKLVREAGRRVE
ncbi:DUF1156 domain-containing protein, partial [Desulfurococcus amylolyticus]|uniref:DUF1156 domain-containing protein n=1 Tax=Desulfurococcus amylolyticus TaxID=94694 RepID=UPI0023F57874